MKKFRRTITLGGVILALGATSFTALAATEYKTPAEALAGVTGKTVESVVTERSETNKTYGTIASEAGKLEEFKKENIQIKKENLKAQVSEGKITQEKADTIIKEIEERQVNCDVTGSEMTGKNRDERASNGLGQGNGHGRNSEGKQRGQGRHGGMRLQDGTCNRPAK